MADPTFAIILAGGRGSRMGGIDKPTLRVGGRRLLDVALEAVSGATRVVVVGPPRDLDPTILQTREEPAGSGPAVAVAAGLAALDAFRSSTGCPHATDGEVAVLAADVPSLTAAALADLSRARRGAAAPAAFALDSTGQMQYLVGVWDMATLRESLAGASGPAMRALIPTDSIGVVLPDEVVADVDTDADLDRARRRAAAPVRLTPPQAAAVLSAELAGLPVVRRRIADALGAGLATGLVAAQPFPSFDASAMDGYAVAGGGPWLVSGDAVAAGSHARSALRTGFAARIATGAMLPTGADRVIRDEEITLDDETHCLTSTFDRDDTRRRGSEWNRGDELIAARTRVDDAVVSVARSAGVAEVDVRGPLRVVVHSTGDEIADDAARAGTIVDTASDAVGNLVRRNGAHVAHGEHLGDRREAFVAALGAPDADVVVLIGATGRGVADHLRDALDDVGARILVDGIDMRPGGSLVVAAVSGGPVIVGLGGNPLAAVAGIALLIPVITDTLLAVQPRPGVLGGVEDLDALARPDGWRMAPVTPTGHGLWRAPHSMPTAHLNALVSARGFALIPPRAHGADLVELYL
ncbi:NTP transferase domain-containing protein [Gordonia sp. TBRC 11910]|uniref:Molybdopterin molybdenumtransferase n=1 Tax=Gordonia asplenii TaxID=2725283 RepID=A0A848KTX7_9ACTN|nr:NTP transferase domain-containing protein [Gordonia asplenii]NMN99620.1 NTP transferase domain-containing protein [Gordonia asplenii]